MIDFRSDLCAVPTDAMWEAMRRAELGWPRFGEDESLNRLCERGAALLGKPAATWVPTCGMANLVALLTFCQPGDRVVLESSSHVLSSEGMAITEIARLEPRPVPAADGRPDADAVAQEIRESGAALLVLENTHTRAGGTVLSTDLTEALAAAASGTTAACTSTARGSQTPRSRSASRSQSSPARPSSVALSLNKGLSAPFGALLAGSETVVERATTILHRLGGATVHRAGIAAAAGLVALDTMIERLVDDHRRARDLAARLSAIPGLALRNDPVETNIVLVDVTATGAAAATLVELLDAAGVRAMDRATRARCGSSHIG